MPEKKSKEATATPKMVAPRRLSQEELNLLYQVLSRTPVNGSQNTRLKADVLEWLEGQGQKPEN